MKKTILVVLMFLIATPCVAGVEPDDDFLHGTVWEYTEHIIWEWDLTLPTGAGGLPCYLPSLAFYKGEVYKESCSHHWVKIDGLSYRNMLGASVVSQHEIYVSVFWVNTKIFFPNGKGIGYAFVIGNFVLPLYSELSIITIEKVEDNWPSNNHSITCTNPDDTCPEEMICIDDKSDDCDPTLGETRCWGFCVNQ